MRKPMRYLRGSVLLESLFALVIIALGALAGFRAAESSMGQHSDSINFAKAGLAAMGAINLIESMADRVNNLTDTAPSLSEFDTGNYTGSCEMSNAALRTANDRQNIFSKYIRSVVQGFGALKGSALDKIAVSVNAATHKVTVRICWKEGESRLTRVAGMEGFYEFSTRVNVLRQPEIG